jgi:hypothetical protein
VADTSIAKKCDNAAGILTGVRREIDHRVESSTVKGVIKGRGRPVCNEALNSIPKGISPETAIEARHSIPSCQKPPDQLIPDEPGSADDEDLHPLIVSDGASIVPGRGGALGL